MNLETFSGKGRNKALFCGVPFLKKAEFDADFLCKIQNAFIFFGRDLAVNVIKGGIPLDLGHGSVLIHDGNVYVISKGIMKVTKDAFSLAHLTGKEKVADDHAASH